ncbi:alanine racemase [Schizosaccharomyces japonicus yFS275]|uniref:Pyridoxal phosphate homeostasis protein n=1 Tax=Schizosaccharomyces japonicus (strain yFS275 / FY16936) TaxID=402676 RepID=B6JXU0_SCHJY|nr:alanine racemase [Schizosaccharomyces japonicus yFS275]EEB06358.1 alanine racemase [Schizosaccharomyces japonicus yFS275]
MTTPLQSRLAQVQGHVKAAAQGRDVRLVAVSKFHPVESLMEAYNAGQRHFGENYMQELLAKAQVMPKDVNWHFIGAMQSSKCKKIASIENLWCIETVDTEKKARLINSAREELNKPLRVYVQVNTSGEDNKSGVAPEDALPLCKFIKDSCSHLQLQGIMTIGSFTNSLNEKTNPDFEKLIQLRKQLENDLSCKLEVSMGMSADYELAIQYGSDNVRVGRTIFGERPVENPHQEKRVTESQ